MRVIFIMLILLVTKLSFATQQIPEEFQIDGAKFDLDTYPLESHPDYSNLSNVINPSMCSASWRGYKGTWVLRKGYLWLDRMIKNACSDNPEYLELSSLFPGKKAPVKATWFTGNINIRISERTFFSKENDGYYGVEFEAVVHKFKSGKLVSRTIESIIIKWE